MDSSDFLLPSAFTAIDLKIGPQNEIFMVDLSHFSSGKLRWQKTFNLQPLFHPSPRLMSVLGLDADTFSSDGSCNIDMMGEIIVLIENTPLVLHYCGNFFSVIQENFGLVFKQEPPDVTDLYEVMKQAYPGMPNYKIQTLCEHFGIPTAQESSLLSRQIGELAIIAEAIQRVDLESRFDWKEPTLL
ncbi:MAG: hypothetical protein KF681_15885 [Bdellovibrionaceae bacterium]|nr:hypothetical protein [Pseudobdellovibrionaceae bacterium]